MTVDAFVEVGALAGVTASPTGSPREPMAMSPGSRRRRHGRFRTQAKAPVPAATSDRFSQ